MRHNYYLLLMVAVKLLICLSIDIHERVVKNGRVVSARGREA